MCLDRHSSFECLGRLTLERSESMDLVSSMVCWLGTILLVDQSEMTLSFYQVPKQVHLRHPRGRCRSADSADQGAEGGVQGGDAEGEPEGPHHPLQV